MCRVGLPRVGRTSTKAVREEVGRGARRARAGRSATLRPDPPTILDGRSSRMRKNYAPQKKGQRPSLSTRERTPNAHGSA